MVQAGRASLLAIGLACSSEPWPQFPLSWKAGSPSCVHGTTCAPSGRPLLPGWSAGWSAAWVAAVGCLLEAQDGRLLPELGGPAGYGHHQDVTHHVAFFPEKKCFL